MKWTRTLVSALVVLIVILTACAPTATEAPQPTAPPSPTETVTQATTEPTATAAEPTPAPAPKVGGTLVIAYPRNPTTLHPLKVHEEGAGMVVQLISGSLIVYSQWDNSYPPYLAESYTVSDDGLVYEFTLKEDVKFHNGDSLTAHDWVYTLDQVMDPESVHSTRASFDGLLERWEAIDDYTVRLTLSRPSYFFLWHLADINPVSQALVEELGDQMASKPVGAGPYMIEEWVENDHITLVRNPDFDWGTEDWTNEGPWYFDRIILRIITDDVTRTAGMETGEIDLGRIAVRDVERFEDLGTFDINEFLYQGIGQLIVFNSSKPPVDDVRVRQAIAYGIDRQAIIDVVLEGKGEIPHSFTTEESEGYWPGIEELDYTYDPTKARELLAEAGYEDSDGDGIVDRDGQPLEVVYLTRPMTLWTNTAQVIQAQLLDIGIKLNIEQLEAGSQIGRMIGGDFDLGALSKSSLLTSYYGLRSDSAYPMWHLPESEALEIDKWDTMGDTATDQATFDEANRQIMLLDNENVYMFQLWRQYVYDGSSKKIVGAVVVPYTRNQNLEFSLDLSGAYFEE